MGRQITVSGPDTPISELSQEQLVAFFEGLGVRTKFELLLLIPVDRFSVPDPDVARVLRENECHNIFGAWNLYSNQIDSRRFDRAMLARIGAILKGFGLPIEEPTDS